MSKSTPLYNSETNMHAIGVRDRQTVADSFVTIRTFPGCFKPNECQKPAIFHETLVMDQLVQLLGSLGSELIQLYRRVQVWDFPSMGIANSWFISCKIP